jgi:hypothetical protein
MRRVTPADVPAADPAPARAAVEAALETALVEEGLRRSAVLWLTLPSLETPRAAWYAWTGGAVHIVHEGLEQSLPGLRELASVDVSLRSKDKGSLLVRFTARVDPLQPDDPRWAAAAAELHARRQSPPDGEAQPARWAASSSITSLTPMPWAG